MSGRGTMTSRTSVSSSSKTLWIISRSVRSTTPSRAPTSTSVRSSSSEISGSPCCRSDPTKRSVMAVSALSMARTGQRSADSHATGRLDPRRVALRVLDGERHRQDLAEDHEEHGHGADGDGQARGAEERGGHRGRERRGADIGQRDADEEGDEEVVGLREERL